MQHKTPHAICHLPELQIKSHPLHDPLGLRLVQIGMAALKTQKRVGARLLGLGVQAHRWRNRFFRRCCGGAQFFETPVRPFLAAHFPPLAAQVHKWLAAPLR